MPAFDPSDVKTLFGKVMGASPSDIKLVAQRLHDHAFEPRMSAEETRRLVVGLGYDSLDAFCNDIGLPAHIAERWNRFGVSGEMKQVFTLLAGQRRRVAEAIAEFESMTHVGVEDFLRERGLI
ncbi:hypothetical protein NKI51_30670 [Mesorhizobium australicum]|uniref:Uncharacterized protein n=1 Tax=Mesorhizobium australicum TaxID=536018 RepID=A0ACC6T199_9HYPH|nr:MULTISPECIES: hypothetical protein [unclassified Mesorhizobium]ESY84593.1 hypothetical protein X739_20760 [Mesorhizobium sp. LNHC220B00]ESY90643.1 hypothetical protein X741_26565 [Mesorhizobium sp. LNHC229A00]ESY97900.1 hypothetical protein X738_18645 [Mesorhizobium sp. LNHC209A00]